MLYEINYRIQELADSLEVDPETGEVAGDVESVIAEIDLLQLERMQVLDYLAKVVLNGKREAEALKAEEDRLKARRKGVERRNEKLMEVLDRECAGNKTRFSVATLYYRRSTRLEVENSPAQVAWLEENGHEDCVKYTPPEVYKSEVTKLIKAGIDVPGCKLVTETNAYLR